jgi:hypothetical protein
VPNRGGTFSTVDLNPSVKAVFILYSYLLVYCKRNDTTGQYSRSLLLAPQRTDHTIDFIKCGMDIMGLGCATEMPSRK